MIGVHASCISPRTRQPTWAYPPVWGQFHDPEPEPNQRDPLEPWASRSRVVLQRGTLLGVSQARKKPLPTFCEYEALDSLRPTYLGSFFLDPRVSRVEVWELSGTLAREQDFLDLVTDYGAQTARFKA
jgi:hypothetical protein